MNALTQFALCLLLLAMPTSITACSVAGCLNGGIELRRDFEIRVAHDGKPLRGVAVEVTRYSEGAGQQSFSELTNDSGVSHFINIPSGDYWVKAELLGVYAGYECFHIPSVPTAKAKKSRKYEWADEAPATREAAGRLVESQPGKGGTPLENLTRRVLVPITGAKLELRQPAVGTVYKTETDANGKFAFGRVPDGTYVLQIEASGGPENLPLEEADLAVRIQDAGKGSGLLVTQRRAGGGSCGGMSLEIEDHAN